MIDKRTVFEIHRLADEGLSVRKIAATLGINRQTIDKYLINPFPERQTSPKGSKLDPFKEEIDRLLGDDPRASAVVIRQRLADKGYDGGITILKDYLKSIREAYKPKRAFIRFESEPGQQFQIDWGHFGSLLYGNSKRKLYCLSCLECHSRMLFLKFTHSQKQETLHGCLLEALIFFWRLGQGMGRGQYADRRIGTTGSPDSV